MTKQEFLNDLGQRLKGLPPEDIEERLLYYCEMIDDRIEEGLSEEEAVSQIGPIENAVEQIDGEKATQKRRLSTPTIVLLILGSPVWLSLLIAAVSIIVSAYASIWAMIISLWAIWGSLIACVIGGCLSSVVFIAQGFVLQGLALVGASLFCGGATIFMFFGCDAATKGIVLLTKKFILWIKSLFRKKEAVK